MSNEILWEEQGACWRFYGNVSLQDIQKIHSAFFGDARFDDQKYLIVDFGGAEKVDVSKDEPVVFAAIDTVAAKSNPYMHLAVVAKTKEIKELVSIYVTNSPWETKVFENIEDARIRIKEKIKKLL